MEDRIAQFHSDAQNHNNNNGISPKISKEIAKLQKFLFRNQSYRFTERDKSHMFSAIECYVSLYSNNLPAEDDTAVSPVLNLLDDALKMPFNIFSTKQKQKLLKWQRQFSVDSKLGNEEELEKETKNFTVVDIDDGYMCLMDDAGQMREDIKLPKSEVGTSIKNMFEDIGSATIEVEFAGECPINIASVNDDV
mmetsp:Transcript_23398/g.30392  ORF Transcript_23398/g.30392 Transcript_23398/m.30392 type:complete len:193 (+) Transcript_23398:29-607(+)